VAAICRLGSSTVVVHFVSICPAVCKGQILLDNEPSMHTEKKDSASAGGIHETCL
jgi:hypothetical protein